MTAQVPQHPEGEDVRAGLETVRFRTAIVRKRTFEAARGGRADVTVRRNFSAETQAPIGQTLAVTSESPWKDSVAEWRGSRPLFRRSSVETQGLECGWRLEPESNRRARICSPLRNHSAIGPEELGGALVASFALGSTPCRALLATSPGHLRFSAQAPQPLVFRSRAVGARHGCRYERPSTGHTGAARQALISRCISGI